MKIEQNIDIQKSIEYIKRIYLYIYTLIYIAITSMDFIKNIVTHIHVFLLCFPYYENLYNKMCLYYIKINEEKNKTLSPDKELDNLVDIIKKLE